MKLYFLITPVFLLLSVIGLSQPDLELKEYQEKYPNVQTVVLQNDISLHVDIVEGELKVFQEEYLLRFYLQDEAGHMTDASVDYNSFSEIQDLEPTLFLPGKKKYKKVKITDFVTADESSSGIFHDDVRSINFSYTGLQKGSKTSLRYTRVVKDPHFLTREYLAWFTPIENLTYRIIADEGVEMGFAAFNIDESYITFSKKTEEGKIIYSWVVKDAKALESESWSPSVAYYAPHIIPYIKSYTVNGEKHEVLRDVNDLFAWYNTFVDGLNEDKDDPDIRALTDSITQGSESEIDKVRDIFYWTQDNVKYIAYEEGMGGFVPRQAAYVCSNRFGDCKDMASTITQLLDYAGIESHLTWIGTSRLPYKYDQVPTPATDNHMIATYIDEKGNAYFLDATGRYNDFGMPSSFIQGKQALVKINESEFKIIEVPVVPADKNKFKVSVNMSVKNDEVEGHAVNALSGYYKSNFEYQIEDMDDKEKKQFYKGYFKLGNNKFLPDNFEERNPYPNPKPFEVEYDFTIKDYALKNGDELYINMNLTDIFSSEKIEKDRKVPVQNKFLSSFESRVTLTIPEGYEVDYVPEKLIIKTEYLDYTASYTVKDNKLIFQLISKMEFLNLRNEEEFKIWNDGNNKAIKASNEVVVLVKKK